MSNIPNYTYMHKSVGVMQTIHAYFDVVKLWYTSELLKY